MGILRLILAISVVLAHSSYIFGFGLVGGQAAVQAFYIISGFYMALVLNEKYIGENRSYKLFISNRLLRLLPIYWAVLLITFLSSFASSIISSGDSFGKIQVYFEYFDSMSITTFLFLVFSNITLLFQDMVMFLGLDTTSGSLFFTSNFQNTTPQLHRFLLIPQAWTISIEIAFYLIAPFLVRKKLKFIFIFIFISILLRCLLISNGFYKDPWSYRFFPTELLFFLLGIVAYHIYKKLKPLKIKTSYLYMIYVFILLFTLSYSFIPTNLKIIPYLFAIFISTPFIFILSKKWKKDRYIGELSYPIYISHMFIIYLVMYLKIPLVGGEGLVVTFITIIFSIFLNEFVAKKIEKIRQRRVKSIANNI